MASASSRRSSGRCEEIVFLTGHGDVPMCAKGMKAGAADFLLKPVDDEVLLSAVQQALDRARRHGRNNAEQARPARCCVRSPPVKPKSCSG